MAKNKLLEPSFADAASVIEMAPDIAPRTRSHWVCSLRQIGKFLQKPLDAIPARWTSIRQPLGRLHADRIGSTYKTLANHKANVRRALNWFAGEHEVPLRGTPLTADWKRLHEQVIERRPRTVLYPFVRYCSAQGLVPQSVDERVLDGYMRYRGDTTALACDAAARRAIARAWNQCATTVPDWPKRALDEPPIKKQDGPVWDDFPTGLRADIEKYLAGYGGRRRAVNGKRIRPCKPSTLKTRRAEIVAAVRMAVREGVDLEALNSLGALVNPFVAEKVLDAYWRRDGEEPRSYTIDLAWKFYSIAHEIGVEAEAIERLDEIRGSLDVYRKGGLTEKNLAVIRQVLSGNVWQDVVKLPAALMVQARAINGQAPVKGAVTAQMAIAIAILTFAPIRLGNLVRIKLKENLTKPGGPKKPYLLVFPDFDVKNRVSLEFPLDADVSGLIDEYIRDFRPTLLRGSRELWLFPGEAGGHKEAKTFSEQITKRIDKTTGLRLTAHQFRHAAAAILLQHRPGEYELARRLLGHRNIQTTMKFYCGLETIQANKIFGDIVRRQIKSEPGHGL